ncbi:hypothetical protein VTI74DRAFT_7577 [Chaetomium olivicolor]
MKFSVVSVLAFAAAVLAKPVFLNSNYEIHEGEDFTLKWNNAQGPVTITLMTGDAKNLKKVQDIAVEVTGTSFTFTPKDLPSGTYAFKITDSTNDPNYSRQFQYVGTGTLTTTSVSSTASSHSSTSVSSTTTTSSTSSTSSGSSSTTSSAASSTTLSTTTSSVPSTTRQASTQTTAPINSNNGQRFASPLALIAVTVAALVFFN